MSRFSRCLVILVISHALFLTSAYAQTVNVIPANLAASHIGEDATVEAVVAKVFISKNGNTFLNIGAAFPNQTFTGWVPNSSPVKDSAVLDGIDGKRVKITGRIEMYHTPGIGPKTSLMAVALGSIPLARRAALGMNRL